MYRKGRIKFPGSVERPGFGDKFCTNAQVRLRTQLKLDANSVKRKRRILIINFERNFGRNSVIFVKNLLVTKYLRIASLNKFFVQKLLQYLYFEVGYFQID